jgi:hypothetical protein
LRRARAWHHATHGSVLALLLAACVEPEQQPYPGEGGPQPVPGVAELAIESGGQVQLEPGAGIGVSVEYSEGGRWSVTSSCDTGLSGLECRYDILVSTDEDAPITESSAVALEGVDELTVLDPFALSAELETGEDTDGFELTTTPGATVRVSALLYDPAGGNWLDWSDDPRFISWVGHGAVHRGAPTNPVDLTPDRP